MHIYTDEEIEKILEITKKHKAQEHITPALQLSLVIFIFIAGIYIIYKSTISENILYKIGSVILMSLIILRNFMIFHDLGHCNYFPSNERTDKCEGINTTLCENLDFIFLYPGKSWIKTHTSHHKCHGNLNEIDEARTFWTTKDYNNASETEKMLYDIIRNPIIFFILAPLWIYFISPFLNIEDNYLYILKTTGLYYLVYRLLNIETVLMLLVSHYIAGIIGLILFHWQHSINEPYWKEFDLSNDKNSKMNAELNGSSVLQIPELLKPFTNGIEYHNVHHVNPGVPSYNIRSCYEELRKEGLLKNREVDVYEMWEALSHTMYDVENDKYINHYNMGK